MRYLLLIYTEEPTEPMTSEPVGEELQAYNAFTTWVREKGMYEAGEALHPTSSATVVRVRDGRTISTDGPFAETKEQLGGFYLVDCRDIDEAIDAASRIPGAKYGAIEVRPIVDFGAAPSAEAVAVAG